MSNSDDIRVLVKVYFFFNVISPRQLHGTPRRLFLYNGAVRACFQALPPRHSALARSNYSSKRPYKYGFSHFQQKYDPVARSASV